MIKIKRLIAIYIDFVVAFIIIYLPMLMVDNIFANIIVVRLFSTIIGLFIFYYIMIYKDLLFKNASIGKKIMGLAIYYNNMVPDKTIMIKRNRMTFSVFPFYIFFILLKNQSYGDLKYNTEVK